MTEVYLTTDIKVESESKHSLPLSYRNTSNREAFAEYLDSHGSIYKMYKRKHWPVHPW